MNPDGKVCLVLLVGIPGSGKSFFRKFFGTYLCDNVKSVLGSVQMWSVCYDDYEHMKKLPNNKWKQCRLIAFKLISNLVEDLKSQESISKTVGKNNSAVTVINKELQSPDSVLILIDDNMYYRSMRYEFYKLAKVHNISFSQIYFDVDLQKALTCNSVRSADSRVPETVIENMYRKLEPPHANHLWEKFSVSVLSYADFQHQDVLSRILSCLRHALDNPVQVRDVHLNKGESLCLTSFNALHQIDNTLKQLVSGRIRSQVSEGNISVSDLNFTSKVYSEKRLNLLKLIKGRVISLPVDLREAIPKDKMNLVEHILSDLLFRD